MAITAILLIKSNLKRVKRRYYIDIVKVKVFLVLLNLEADRALRHSASIYSCLHKQMSFYDCQSLTYCLKELLCSHCC